VTEAALTQEPAAEVQDPQVVLVNAATGEVLFEGTGKEFRVAAASLVDRPIDEIGATAQAAKHVMSLRLMASTEETRPNLQCIHLRKDGYAEATDGHALARCKYERPDGGTLEMLLPVDIAGVAQRLGGKEALLELRREESLACVAALEHEVSAPEVVGDYPKTDDVWPKGAPVFEVALNAGLLFRLARALSIGKGQNRVVRLGFFSTTTGDTTPILVSPYASDEPEPPQGVIMPCRLAEAPLRTAESEAA